MKILVATGNPGKVKEYQEFFSELPVEFVSLNDVGITEECEETGDTLKENSLQKAQFYGDLSGLPAVADDAGLFVDVLEGRPGVYSSRYANSDEERMEKLLQELEKIPYNERGADFRLVTTLYYPDTKEHVSFEGKIRGIIAEEKKQLAQKGFGYDPIFYVPEEEKTFAEMMGEEKNAISHRGIAFRKLKKYLEK
ncbi:RdgB/HAM1 family non-canonical purine NTP pyrophosphatase [Patescibacteria group bacterium]|nr:RdgB/HAM1 family non-canonical purine NTP pyrophosphatase [Patescibacteria group bacterium]